MWHFRVTLLMVLFYDSSYSCRSAEYEINGECCPMCSPGTRVYKHCTEYTSTTCVPCTKESFIDQPNGLSICFPCTVCDPDRLGLKTDRKCTASSDAVCGPLDQYYCTGTDNKGCKFAEKHKICSPGQFIIHKGTTSTNTKCGDCPDKTFSNESSSTSCKHHTDCQSLGLEEMTAGTNTLDSECGTRPSYGLIVAVLLSVLLLLSLSCIILILRRRKQNMETRRIERERTSMIEKAQDEDNGAHELIDENRRHPPELDTIKCIKILTLTVPLP
ncbi:hypothetical protein SKAU_G00111840 [Synaphobranchus kaupii]|uniref:TNFR-Cys domain-containing protein n=1 Tax=Synaphobranchus kaupii TaxID=118154 RepID=A0A9Q1G0N8_SYNKA|nr:hypothetical protein SKAU_G00111840 [Synaphobranchus kaupii]